MKIKELKHNHSLTDLLKILLFSILMLAPILAIGVKCAYVVINKNAKDSYSGANGYSIEYKYETNEVETMDDVKLGNIYKFDFKTNLDATGTGYFTITKASRIYFLSNDTNKIEYDLAPIQNSLLTLLYNRNNSNLYLQSGNDSYIGVGNISLFNNYIYIVYGGDINPLYTYNDFLESDYNEIKGVTISNTGTLDNVFYYAIDEVAQEPLFNWTQNTAIYTGVNAMCTGMEITNTIIPILITYWFLLTCIYVIIDILIKGFTMLTHLIGSKLA